MNNRRIKSITKVCVCTALTLMLVLQLIPAMPLGVTMGYPVGATDGEFTVVPGNFYFSGGATSGYNHFHIFGNEDGQAVDSFWQNTFCIEKDHSAAPGNEYSYYYNAASVGDPGFASFVSTVLGVNGMDMTAAQWAMFRNCIMYVNVNRDARGQYVLWSGLGHFLPTKYSRAGSFGDSWQDVWLTKYFGAVASSDFMGLGTITTGQTIDIGAAVDIGINYPVGFNPGGTVLNTTSGRIGPFSLQWTTGSSAALAQLNCGPNKTTPPLFNLGADNNSVRFYKNNTTMTPTSSVRLGDEFYIEWNENAKTGGTTSIKVSSVRELITKVVADQFFLNPVAQNQANVETETDRPEFGFIVTTPVYSGPTPPVGSEGYIRPEIEKQVATDNHTDNTGDFKDTLEVYPGTDVFHKMTVTSTDPKGTILTFQNTDYDLYPSVLQNHAIDWAYNVPGTTALVYNAAEFKAAIDANKDIKLMADIMLPNDWVPSAAIYSGIFDGNNYKLIGGSAMTRPVFGETINAVFYRVQFVGFTMNRVEGSGTRFTNNNESFGALVDLFIGDNSKMLDCYVQGTMTVDVHDATAAQLDTVGGVAGRAYGEIYGVQALLNLTIECGEKFFGYSGGVFGYVSATIFENNELLKDSVVTNGNQLFGGISGGIWAIGSELKVRNCKADYTYNNIMSYSGTRERRFGGMFFFTTSKITLIDRCIVNCAYDNSTGAYVNVFSGLVGEYSNDPNIKHPSRTFSNCDVVFTGGIVRINSNDSDTQRGQLGSGAGIINLGVDGEWELGEFNIEYCSVEMNIGVANNAGAGIFNDVRRVSHTTIYTHPEPYMLNISHCTVSGQIVGSGPGSVIGGIATDTAVNAAYGDGVGLQGGSIDNCIVTAELIADVGRIGGIWATRYSDSAGNKPWSRPLTSHSTPTSITNCIFAGEIDAGSATARDIYACSETTPHSCATAFNNYTTFNTTANDATSPYGLYVTNAADAALPAITPPAPRVPVQRIYVTDYYHQNNTQEFVENLYVWEGGAFKHISLSTYRVASDMIASTADRYVDIYMAPGTHTFTFYYFVGNNATQSKTGGEDGPWNSNSGLVDNSTGYQSWQNTVKITPRDNKLVDDGSGGKKFDWTGDYDDDWVFSIEQAPEIRLNIIKMTGSSGFPVPLEGSVFTLNKTDELFSNPTSAVTLSPSGFIGLTVPPVLTEGKYTLVETAAPAYYSVNVGRTWYLVFSNDVLEMYTDPSLAANTKTELGEEVGINTLTYTAVFENERDSNAPLARISLIKYDDTGSLLPGGLTGSGTHFTGAIYGLFRFEGSGFTGYSHNYGNPLIYGGGQQNWCDIEPGYYELLEIKAPDGFALNPTPTYIYFDGTMLIINGDKSSDNQSTVFTQGKPNEKYVTVNDLDQTAKSVVIEAIDRKPPPPLVPPDTVTPTPAPPDVTTPPDEPALPDDSPDKPEESPVPVPYTSESTMNINLPTIPQGNTLVQNEDGSYTEFDENGIPRGRWTWDEENEIWIFEEYVPLGDMPSTGDDNISIYFFFLLGASFLGVGIISKFSQRKRESREQT